MSLLGLGPGGREPATARKGAAAPFAPAARTTGGGGGGAPAEGDPADLASWMAPLARGAPAPQERTNPNEPQRLCVKADGRKKVHTTNPDGSEMVEEFDERT